MGDIRNERPTLRGVDPYKCSHPKFMTLWRFRGCNEIIYRCMVSGMRLSTSDLESKEPWRRGSRRNR